MTVDIDNGQGDGKVQASLGPVEKRVVGIAMLIIVAVIGWFGKTVISTQESLNGLATQQAVMSGQLVTLTSQLADVPALRTQVVESKVRLDRHEEDIKELRANRGLR